MSDKQFIDFDTAALLLPEKEHIHTFRQAGIALIGADWDRIKILDALLHSKIELTGPSALKMGHGIAIDYQGYLFIETDEAKINKFYEANPELSLNN